MINKNREFFKDIVVKRLTHDKYSNHIYNWNGICECGKISDIILNCGIGLAYEECLKVFPKYYAIPFILMSGTPIPIELATKNIINLISESWINSSVKIQIPNSTYDDEKGNSYFYCNANCDYFKLFKKGNNPELGSFYLIEDVQRFDEREKTYLIDCGQYKEDKVLDFLANLSEEIDKETTEKLKLFRQHEAGNKHEFKSGVCACGAFAEPLDYVEDTGDFILKNIDNKMFNSLRFGIGDLNEINWANNRYILEKLEEG